MEQLRIDAVTAIRTCSSREEISDVASKLRCIPANQHDKVLPRVVNKIIRSRFLYVAADLYTENEELNFRQDLIFVLWAVIKHGGSVRKKVINDIVVRVTTEESIETSDAKYLFNVLDIILHIMNDDIDDSAILLHLTELDFYNKIFKLLDVWKNDEHVLELLLTIICRLCFNELNKEKEMIVDEKEEGNISCFTNIVRQNAQIFENLLEVESKIKRKLVGQVSVILRKYIGSIDENKFLKMLIPEDVFTDEGLSTLAENLRSFSYFEEDICKKIFGELVSMDFIEKIIDAYENHPNCGYRENLTYVVKILLLYNGETCGNLLVTSGVLKYLVEKCNNECKSNVVSNILDTVSYLRWKTLYRSTIITEIGITVKISEILQKDSIDEEVMTGLLNTLCAIKYHFDHLSGLVENLLTLLYGVLETNSNETVISETLGIVHFFLNLERDEINNIFLQQKFFDIIFRHFQSDTIDAEGKYRILSIVHTLMKKHPDPVIDLTRPFSYLLFKQTDPCHYEFDLKVNRFGALMSYKYLNNRDASEILECFVVSQDQMFTMDGIFSLSESIKAIPYDVKDFQKEVIGQMVTHGFIDKVVDAYGNYHDHDYRKELLNIVEFIADHCEGELKSLMVDNGMIDFMISQCEGCESSKLICGFLDIFGRLVWNDDKFSLSQSLQMEILTKIPSLRKRWSKNEKVMGAIASLISNFDTEDGSILDVISNELLVLINTDHRNSVLESSFYAIERILEKLMKLRTDTLHMHYLKSEFFGTLFKHFESDSLESGGKYNILGIVHTLVLKFPETTVNLMMPHSKSLLKQTNIEFQDLRWNGLAVLLSYKHLDTKDVSEALEYFVPPQELIYTTNGMVRMIEIFKSIPYDEKEFKREVIGQIISQGFIEKIAEVFESQADDYFRENFLEVIDMIVEYGESSVKASMVENGTVNFMIDKCGTSEKSQFVNSFLDILKRIAWHDDDFDLSQSLQEEIIRRVPEWCKKWGRKESVMSALARTLWFVINNIETENTSSLENLATVLDEIIKTNLSSNVVEEAFEVIERIVHKEANDNINSLHANYLNQEFFKSLFLHLTSATNQGSFKETAMKIIMDLARDTSPETIKTLLSPHIESIKNFCKDDPTDEKKMKVNAVIVLYKYMEAMEYSEVFQQLIPSRESIFSDDGMSDLAAVLYAFPYEEQEIKEKLVSQILSDESLTEAFGEAYVKNTEETYRTNLTRVLREIVFCGNIELGSSLVSTDVTKKLIESWTNCTKHELMDNICSILLYLASDHANVVSFGEQGVLQSICTLLKTWPERHELIGTTCLLQLLTKMVEVVAIKEKILDLIDLGFNLPEQLIYIFESSKDLSTMNDLIECIKYVLKDSMALHGHFSNQRFIDSCLSRMKSDWLPTEDRVKILWSIVTRLSYNNPQKLSALLAPHSQGQT